MASASLNQSEKIHAGEFIAMREDDASTASWYGAFRQLPESSSVQDKSSSEAQGNQYEFLPSTAMDPFVATIMRRFC